MDPLIASFAEHVLSARGAATALERYREGFGRLRLDLHPDPSLRAPETFIRVAGVANAIAEDCLPLALGVVMHLYPLCALQCVPLPALSRPWQRRRQLVRDVHRDRLILANAGSERAAGKNPALTAVNTLTGVVVDGAFEYVSLASVADLVLFEAPLADGSGIAVCAADARASSVRIGAHRFHGAMRLSDTRSMSFTRHFVPHERCFVMTAASRGLDCIRDYQRCWFHLLLAEIHRARIDCLHRAWRLAFSPDHSAALDEIDCLRERCLRLIDAPLAGTNLVSLTRASATLKLRVSQLAQSTAAQLRALGRDAMPDADELEYIRLQPTADAKILQSMAVAA